MALTILKSEDRLAWEQNHDCKNIQNWILENKVCTQEELNQIDEDIQLEVREAKKTAFKEYQEIPRSYLKDLSEILRENKTSTSSDYKDLLKKLNSKKLVFKRDTLISIDLAKNIASKDNPIFLVDLTNWRLIKNQEFDAYSSELIDESHRV